MKRWSKKIQKLQQQKKLVMRQYLSIGVNHYFHFLFRPEINISFLDIWTGETAFLPHEHLDLGRPLNTNVTQNQR